MNLPHRMASVWQRGKNKVSRLFGNTSPEMNITHESTCCLPYEIVEAIIDYLFRDREALKACSLTCRSWYIAAVPHIHRSLLLGNKRLAKPRDILKPLSELRSLGLTPFVKQITIRQWLSCYWFTPQAFSSRNLRHFSAFTNVQALKLENMDISSFVPGIERYFEHFSPTVQSITLWGPCCTPRQLSHFLSLFSNLNNVGIWGVSARPPKKTVPDDDLTLFSTPILGGELGLSGSHWTETWIQLITLCGCLRFSCMNLYKAGDCARLLLEACTETLETLRFSPADDSSKHVNAVLHTISN